MLAEENIEQLEARLLSGDDEALVQLFERFRPRLERFVKFKLDARLRGRIDVCDVMQELFLAAEQRLVSFRRDQKLRPYVWFREIAAQRILDIHRRHITAQKRSAMNERSIEANSRSWAGLFAEDISSPSQRLANLEVMQQIQSTIESLSEVDREILFLRHFEELSNDEVAQILKITKAGASNRYVRALERLRKALDRIPGFND